MNQTKELEAIAQRLGELDDNGNRYKKQEVAGIKAESLRGRRGFERALWRLRALLDWRGTEDSQHCEVEEEAPRRNHGMTPEMVLRFNRLATIYGFDVM